MDVFGVVGFEACGREHSEYIQCKITSHALLNVTGKHLMVLALIVFESMNFLMDLV